MAAFRDRGLFQTLLGANSLGSPPYPGARAPPADAEPAIRSIARQPATSAVARRRKSLSLCREGAIHPSLSTSGATNL